MAFKKGNKICVGRTPWNKGTKGKINPNSGSFKKGHKQVGIYINTKARQEARKKGAFPKGHKINIGKKNHLGFKHSDKTKKLLRDKSLKQFENGMPINTRIKMCENNAQKGEKSPWWKGGITPINFKIRKSLEYRLWRESVFKRDNYQCIWGGKEHGSKLVADHIKPFALFPELRFAIDNGRTLCEECHKKTPSYLNNFNKNKHLWQ